MNSEAVWFYAQEVPDSIHTGSHPLSYLKASYGYSFKRKQAILHYFCCLPNFLKHKKFILSPHPETVNIGSAAKESLGGK